MKRIFIAIRINGNAALRKLTSELKEELSGSSVRWTDPSNLHLTLAFLGDTEEKTIPAITAMLNEKCRNFGKFDFVIRGIGVFKNLRDPKVMWAGIDKPEKLNSLQSAVIDGLKETGTTTEDRQFSPHLTIGRIKHINDGEKLKILLLKYHTTDIQSVAVEEIILYESILHQNGPEYRVISVHSL